MDAVQQQCEACIKLWLDGGGQTSEATKGALSHLIQQNPKHSLPRRYLARLLFHEAAGAISPGTVGSNSSLQRIQLLTDAYEHAAVATDLSPNSLSCAALRATLAINLLVEESALLTPAQPVTNGPQAAAAASGSNSKAVVEQHTPQQPTTGCTVLDRKCQELLQRFLGSIDACKTALEHPQPVLREPLITFTTSTHTTCDPCSLLVEKIMDCSRAGKLQEVVAEKRSVLTSMQQVLQSCYALLDSTQVPLHSIIRLLQHILRPYGAEQQMLASSRVSSDSSSSAASSSSTPAPQLPASQLHHAAIGELLRLLRPGSNPAYSSAAAAASAAHAAAAAASAAAAGSGHALPALPAPACEAVAQGGPPADADLAPLPLSVEKPWDPPSTSATAAGTKAAAGSARGGNKGRGGRSRAAGAAAGGGKKRERSRRERFTDVETFWRSCSPQQRLHLLRVPLAPLLATIQQESGAAAAEVLMEGLVLLREQEHSSCYWLCAACDRKFHTARDFNTHLETCHEQLVLAKQQPQPQPVKSLSWPPGSAPAAAAAAAAAAVAAVGKPLIPPQQQAAGPFASNGIPLPAAYVTCGKCQAAVVGMYYARVQAQKRQQQQQQQQPALPAGEQEALDQMHSICIKCYRELSTLLGDAGAERSYSRVTPHAPSSPSSAWSESGSEFISTRDSFSSCPDDAASTESLSDCDAPGPAAAARRMQLQPYDAGRSSRGRHGHTTHAHTHGSGPCDKEAEMLCPALRAQHQRSLAWRAHTYQPGCCSSGAGGSGHSPQEQQQQQQGQGDQAATPPPSSGIFVFGSSSNSSGTSAAAGGTSSSTAGSGSFGPPSPVPAAAAAASPGHPGTSPVAAAPQVQPGSMPSPSSRPPAKQQQSSSSSSSLAAYWQQQQLLLCSTDPAAIELLDGLDVVQRAKQLDGKQRRSPSALSPHRQAGASGGATGRLPGGAGPVTGSKRPTSAAGPCGSTSSAEVGSTPSLGPVNTSHAAGAGAGAGAGAAGSCGGDAAAAAAAAAGSVGPSGVCELDAGGDAGTPSAGNRTWRDWLLPKKLLQWNDDDGEMTHDESPGSSDSGDDVMTRHGGDQGHTGQVHNTAAPAAAAAAVAAAAAPAGVHVHGGSTDGCCDSEHSSRSASAACATASADGAAAVAAGQAGIAQPTVGSAPCSPRTPTAHDSCRGGAEPCSSACPGVSDPSSSTAGSSKQQHAPAAVATTTSSSSGDSSRQASTTAPAAAAPAGAADTAGAKADSLGACLAAAAPCVLVDEVMHCMQHLYEADGDLADETLLCLVDFVLRKLDAPDYKRISIMGGAAAVLQASRRSSPLQLDQVSPLAAAGAAAAGLSADDCTLAAELLVAPELALMCPRAMRAAMCCLCSSDLHMALAYIVRQAGTPLSGAFSGEIVSSYGSDTTGSVTSSSGAGSVSGDEGLEDSSSHSDSQVSDEETGCMSLFQLYHLDEEAFVDLAGLLRPGQKQLINAASSAAAAGKAVAGSKALGGSSGSSQLSKQAQQASAQQAGKGSSGANSSSSKREQQRERLEPVLLVAPWWLEHLRTSSKAKDPSGDAEVDIRVLRWVYGNIESAQAEELASRQASLRGGLDRTPALLELYEALAEAWRRMQRVADRQRRLEQLRSRVKAKFADVKALEEAAQHGTSQQATAFLDSLQNSISPPVLPSPVPALPDKPSGVSSTPVAAAAPAPPAAAAPDAAVCPIVAAADAAATPEQQKQQRAAAIAASAALSPLMQLTTYMTKLAPLYLCEAAVAGVRSAPLLASEASQQYACALLQRELAVLALMEAKLEHDVAVARQRLQAANERLLAKRGTELVAAEAEQAKLIAEGPASHRKKDLLDKATKETEHRQKLAEVKNRIDAAKAAIAEDENVAASAELAAAEGTTALLHVQDLVRQMNMRLKTLQDFNAQLGALMSPQHAAAAAAGQQRAASAAAAALTDSQGASSSSSCSATHPPLDSGDKANAASCSVGPQAVSMPPPAPASPYVDAHAEWTLRARRLECLMCRVLWVAETIRLFDGQYDTDRVTAGNSSSTAAGTGAGAAAGAAGQGLAPAAGVQPRFSQPRTTPGDLLSASRWVRGQGEELDASFHAAAEELGLLRSSIQQLACVDLTFDLHGAALNYVRRRIEAASAAAQEMRSQQLLLELAEEEEAAKKALTGPTKQQQQQQQQQAQQQLQTQQVAAVTAAAAAAAPQERPEKAARNNSNSSSAAAAAAAGSAAAAQPASGRAAKGKKAKQEQAKPAASKPTPKASTAKQQIQLDAAAAQEQAKRDAAERQQALEAARAAREAAIEKELEKRRQELQAMEEAAEAELIRLAEEASLKEQAAQKAAAEKERLRKEQQALEPPAAATVPPAAAAAAPVKPASAASPAPQDKASTGAPAGSNTKGRQGRQPAAAAAAAIAKGTQAGPAAPAAAAAAGGGGSSEGTAGAAGVRPVPSCTPQVTGPGAVQAAARAAKQQAAARQVISPVAGSKQQQQQTPASSPGPAKKAGRGGQAEAAAATGRGGKAQPGSNASTPSKQQRSKQQQQPAKAQPAQLAVPVMLDFGPTPAEAYAAQQAGAAAAAAEATQGAAAAVAADAAVQDSGAHQQDWQGPQQQLQALGAPQHHQHHHHQQQGSHMPAAGPAPAPGAEPFGLTAADAVVHMPVSTASSSSHLALLSQGQDGLALPGAISSSGSIAAVDHRSSMFADSAASSSAAGALSSAAPGSAFAPAAVAGNSINNSSSSASQAFTADAPLTGFSPAPGGHLLSLGSGHLQFQAAASEAVRTLSGPSSLLQGPTGPGQGFGSSQDLSLGFGGLGSFSRQGSASLQGPELNPGGAGLTGVGSKGAAAMMLGSGGMGPGPAASTAMIAGSGMMTAGAGAAAAAARGHLLPPRPSLSSTAGDTLLGSGALEVPAGIFRQAGGPGGLGSVQLPSDSFGGVDSGLEPVSPQLGCSPTGDALHIQSIMSLLDDTGVSNAVPASAAAPAAPAGAPANRAAGRQGKKQQQVDQQSKQQPQVQQQQRGQARQQRQKQAPQQLPQQQQRAAGRGRNSASPGPDATAAGRDTGGLAAAQPGSSTSSGDLTQPANSSASSSMNGTLSPLRPPGLSVASTASLSSRPSSAGSTSAAAGDALGAATQRQQQQQQQLKAVQQQASSQLWGGGYGTTSAAGAGMAHGYSGHSWAGPGVSDVGVNSSDAGFGVVGRSAGVAPGLYRGARSCADSGTAAAAAAMAAGGGMWGGMGTQASLHNKASDVGPARDQQRPGSAGRGSYAGSAQATHAQHSNAHMAAAAAAAAATAAVKQAQQQAVAAAAAAAVGSQGGGLHGRGAAGLGGLYSAAPQDMSALFGASSASLLSATAAGGGLGGLGRRAGPYLDAAGFGGLSGTMGGFSGGLGAAHAAAIAGTRAVGSGLGDLSGHWQHQQQQQAALLRYGGGLGALQQQQLWSQPPNADGSQGVQW